ncbi:MAG: hypothetical protein RLZZ15_1714, partial [Verrucomicrobiota bacterium]
PDYASAARLLAQSHLRVAVLGRDQESRVLHARESKRWGELTQKLMPGGAGDGVLSNYYSIGEADCVRALPLAENAVRALPNDAESHHYLALALLGFGRLDEAITQIKRAIELEPRNLNYHRNLVNFCSYLRRAPECRAAVETYYSVRQPGDNRDTPILANFRLSGELPKSLDDMTPFQRVGWLWRSRRFEETLVAIEEALASPEVGDLDRLELLGQKCEVLKRLTRDSEAGAAARATLVLAEKLQAIPEIGPTEKPRWLALAYSRTGRVDDAVTLTRRFIEGMSPVNQALWRWRREVIAAEIYASVGRRQECCELLAKMLRTPSALTVPMLKVDPTWDNLREEAGFKALLADPKNSAEL